MRLTWESPRRRAGAGSLCAAQRRVRCSQVRRWLREMVCGPRRPIRYGDGGGRARCGGYAMLRRGIVIAGCAVQSERGDAAPTCTAGRGFRAGMTGSTTLVAPCPNIPLGWPFPWALRQAAARRAHCPGGGGGRPCDLFDLVSLHRSTLLRAYPAVAVARHATYRPSPVRPPFLLPYDLYPACVAWWVVGWPLPPWPGGGGRGAPFLADWAAAHPGPAPGGPHPHSLPTLPLPPLSVAAPSLSSSLGGMGSGTSRGQAERALDRSFAAIRILHAMYSRRRCRRPMVGPTARPCARSDWAGRVRWGGPGGQVLALAGRRYSHRPPGSRA